jgi:excisionase family DNA binding protein
MTQHDAAPTRRNFEQILQQDTYTPEEAAYLLGIDNDTIYTAAQRGDLKATFVGNDLVSIERGDLVDWLDTGDQR